MGTVERVSIQISKGQKNAAKELKSSDTVVLKGPSVTMVHASPE